MCPAITKTNVYGEELGGGGGDGDVYGGGAVILISIMYV